MAIDQKEKSKKKQKETYKKSIQDWADKLKSVGGIVTILIIIIADPKASFLDSNLI